MSGRFPLLRGLIVVVFFTWGVPLISFAIFNAVYAAQLGLLANASFSIVLLWVFLFLPHFVILPEPFSSSTAVALALGQWITAGLAVGHFTRSMSNRRTLAAAFIAIAVLALALHGLIRVLGYRVVLEYP